MNWYEIKGYLLKPYIASQRRKHADANKMQRAILEATRYSRAFYRFAEANYNQKLLQGSLGLSPDDVVMDVGGFNGEWAAALVELYDPIIHVYEPMPSSIRKLEERFANNPKVAIHPVGLAASSGEHTLSLKGPGSSIIEQDSRKGDAGFGQTSIQLQDVNDAFAELPDGDVNLFKINIEGAEYEVLERMLECGLMERCEVIMIQYHEFVTGAHGMRRSINRRLAKTHRVVWDYKFIWERWERK